MYLSPSPFHVTVMSSHYNWFLYFGIQGKAMLQNSLLLPTMCVLGSGQGNPSLLRTTESLTWQQYFMALLSFVMLCLICFYEAIWNHVLFRESHSIVPPLFALPTLSMWACLLGCNPYRGFSLLGGDLQLSYGLCNKAPRGICTGVWL